MTHHLVTSALPYSNGRLHVGHIAGAYLPADTYVRFLRARGDQVRFICGSDDNGVAALISARREGKTPEELTAHYHARQKADLEGLGIRFDIYGGTHQPGFAPVHERISQGFFKTIANRGFFKKKPEIQLYDETARQFLPDRYVKGTCYTCKYPEAYGDQCENCGNPIDPARLVDPVSTISGTRPVPRETTHWFLQLGQFEERLRTWLESKRGHWRDHVVNFALGQIKKGLPERAMTRDLSWGIPVPLKDPDAAGKVLYVWFDAPIGYVSFTAKLCEQLDGDARAYERWWKDSDGRIEHFIGEDNIVFHALTWPAMLLAEGTYQLPWAVVANAFLKIKFPGREEEKISKSRGTAIWIEEFLKRFEPDPLRYYLTAVAPESARTTFDLEDFVTRNNSELVNTLGNFVNRTVTFVHRYLGGATPSAGPAAQSLDTAAAEAVKPAAELLEKHRFRDAMSIVMNLARVANRYFEDRAPWKQRTADPVECASTLHCCLRTVRTLATLMAPFLPFSASKCARMLRLDPALPWRQATDDLPAGHALGEAQILFRKIEMKEVQ